MYGIIITVETLIILIYVSIPCISIWIILYDNHIVFWEKYSTTWFDTTWTCVEIKKHVNRGMHPSSGVHFDLIQALFLNSQKLNFVYLDKMTSDTHPYQYSISRLFSVYNRQDGQRRYQILNSSLMILLYSQGTLT